jgi:hypothetical protein
MVKLSDKSRKRKRQTMCLLLEALARGGTTPSLGRPTPYLDRVTELRSMWYDVLYWKPDELQSDGIISEDEKEALDRVTTAMDTAMPLGCDIESTIEVARTRIVEWRTLMLAANNALSFMRKPRKTEASEG